MLQLKNETPFTVGMFVLPDARGVDTLYCVVKATFEARGERLAVAPSQEPLRLEDEPWGEPATTGLKHASELHLGCPGTDVLVTGHVYAPRGRAVTTLDASLGVGPVRGAIRVIGPRALTGANGPPYHTSPEPFQVMPLRYELAFGGAVTGDGLAGCERRNPVGQGWLPEGVRDLRPWRGHPLPCLEDPAAPWTTPGDRPAPRATGPVSPAWLPRARFVGTYDDRWQTRRAPYLPEDFDARFFHVAPPWLTSPTPLRGDEPVELARFTPDGDPWRCALPGVTYDAHAVVGRVRHLLRFSLETVHLRPDERTVTLVHRAAVACDKRTLQIESVRLALASLAERGTAA